MRFPPDVYKALGRAATLHERTANAQAVQYVRDGLQREGLLVAAPTNRIGIVVARFVDKHGHNPNLIRAASKDVAAAMSGRAEAPEGKPELRWRGILVVIDATVDEPVAEMSK